MEPATGKLTTPVLLWAYSQGWFPMANPHTREIEWYSPDPRAVFPLDAFHIPKSLGRLVRSARFDIRSDTSFEEVMRACAAPRSDDPLGWIDDRMLDGYVRLHRVGHAHTIEAWHEGKLVGGLYGVHVGGAFFGESMFTRPDLGGSNASKICLVHLVRWLRRRGFVLLDTQFHTEHLAQFGCLEIPRSEYMKRLRSAIGLKASWGIFDARATCADESDEVA
jgi:leucyl/phenylalanyl-tRNA--protein transferase